MGLFTLDRDLLPENWGKTRPSGKPVLGEPPAPARKEASSEASMRAEMLKEPIYLVTDTSWWMEDGWRIATGVAERLRDGEPFFVVPAGVMRELDGLKKNPEKGKRALEATKRIHELVSMGRARIVRGNGSVKDVLASPVDEEVLSVAREWKEKGKTYLLTTDRAQMAVGENEKIYAIKFYGIKRDPLIKFIDSLPWIFSVLLMLLLLPFWFLYFKTMYKKPNTYKIIRIPAKKVLDDHFPGNVGCPCPVCSDD